MENSADTIRVIPVTTRQHKNQFLDVTRLIYQNDPHWVAPLRFEMRQRLSEKKNPFFRHAYAKTWLAMRGTQPVGRISAQIDSLQSDDSGHFGLLEGINNQAVFSALLEQAENWLRGKGVSTIRGPYNLSINEECGMLVDGFDTPPCIMMSHALPYYKSLISNAGYGKAMDLLAYLIPSDFEAPKVMARLAERALKKVNVRTLRRKHLQEDLEILRDIFNDAWSENWDFVPFTREEFQDIGQMISLLVDDDLVQIAEIDQRPVAFVVAMPNINEAIRDLNGKLLPFGWVKLLWRLKVKYPKSARTPLLGVRKQYHHTPLGPSLAFIVIEKVRRGLVNRNVSDVELSWILETNEGMRNIVETIGGIEYKRYRIYEKNLSQS